MKYRTIIVDDEQVIRNGLKTVVDWESIGFCVAGAFASGTAALEWLRSERADVMLVDVHMPGMSGLELIRAAKEVDENVVAVVLSGFDKFEYAQEAIDCGVFGYLLKPVREDRITELFERLRLALDERAQRARNASAVTESEGSRLLLHVLRHGGAPAEETLVQLRKRYPALEVFPEAGVMLVEIVSGTVEQVTRDVSVYTLLDAMEDLLRSCGPTVRFSERLALSVVLTGEAEEIRSTARHQFSLLVEMAEGHPLLGLSAALGCTVRSFGDLPLAQESAEKTLNRRLCEGLDLLIEYDEATGADVLPRAYVYDDTDIALEFVRGVLDANAAKAEDAIERVFCRLREEKICDIRPADSRLRMMIDTVASQLELYGVPIDLTRGELHAALDRALTMPTYQLSARVMVACTGLFVELASNHRSDPRNAAVITAVDYIRENLADDLSLDRLAELVQMSPSYFSRLFKHVMGENFKDYVTNQRLEEAKRMLRTTTAKVYAVADDVGFRDNHYFSEVFKRKTGLTPLEYRNRSRLESS